MNTAIYRLCSKQRSYNCSQLGRDSTSAVERDSGAVHKCTGTATQEQARPSHILRGSNAAQRHTSPDGITE